MITLHYVARAWCLDAFSLTHHRRARSAHACASLQRDDDDGVDADDVGGVGRGNYEHDYSLKTLFRVSKYL